MSACVQGPKLVATSTWYTLTVSCSCCKKSGPIAEVTKTLQVVFRPLSPTFKRFSSGGTNRFAEALPLQMHPHPQRWSEERHGFPSPPARKGALCCITMFYLLGVLHAARHEQRIPSCLPVISVESLSSDDICDRLAMFETRTSKKVCTLSKLMLPEWTS